MPSDKSGKKILDMLLKISRDKHNEEYNDKRLNRTHRYGNHIQVAPGPVFGQPMAPTPERIAEDQLNAGKTAAFEDVTGYTKEQNYLNDDRGSWDGHFNPKGVMGIGEVIKRILMPKAKK